MTSLVKDTLGGSALSVFFFCISPSNFDIEATSDTLRFSQYTGKIKCKQGELFPTIEEEKLLLLTNETADLEKFCSGLKQKINQILNPILPELMKGAQALDKINKNDLFAIKSLKSPVL